MAHEWNEIEYVWMNEEDSMFAKTDSLVEVPYVEPSFLGCLNAKSIILRSHGIWMNDINNVMCYMNYNIYYVKYVMCCLQNDKFDDACYTHGITFEIKILHVHWLSWSLFGKSTDLTFHKSCCKERSILTYACPFCVLSYTHT